MEAGGDPTGLFGTVPGGVPIDTSSHRGVPIDNIRLSSPEFSDIDDYGRPVLPGIDPHYHSSISAQHRR